MSFAHPRSSSQPLLRGHSSKAITNHLDHLPKCQGHKGTQARQFQPDSMPSYMGGDLETIISSRILGHGPWTSQETPDLNSSIERMAHLAGSLRYIDYYVPEFMSHNSTWARYATCDSVPNVIGFGLTVRGCFDNLFENHCFIWN